jgi:hypothetical protein
MKRAIAILLLAPIVANGQKAPDALPRNQTLLNCVLQNLGHKVGTGICLELITRPLGLSVNENVFMPDEFGNTLAGQCIDSVEMQPGDIIYYTGMISDSGEVVKYGHIGIIYSVFPNFFLVAEQNVEKEESRSKVVISHPIELSDGYSAIKYSYYRPWPRRRARPIPRAVEERLEAGGKFTEVLHSANFEYVFDMDDWPNTYGNPRNEKCTIYLDLDSCQIIVDSPFFSSTPIDILSVATDTVDGLEYLSYKLANPSYHHLSICRAREEVMLDSWDTKLDPVYFFKEFDLCLADMR